MKNIMVALVLLTAVSCGQPQTQEAPTQNVRLGNNRAKFEPKDGEVILFVGQELNAIGGLEEYNDGYMDHYDKPAGFTMYTNLSPGDTSFGYVNKGLDGVYSTADWGDNESNMSLQLESENFDNMALAIGLSMVNHEDAVANGDRDSLIVALGTFIKSLAPRPVFLRIGYEFDGHTWNYYDRESYITAYKRVVDKINELEVDNVAYVWQSVGWVSTPSLLDEWYPGDEYVDWCSFSFFSRWREQEMIAFARAKDKPVFIAESTPVISDHMVKFDGTTKEIILSNPTQAIEAWDKWFVPYFDTIEDNGDVVKAISYINCNWRSHQMWKVNPTFLGIDARLQTSELIDRKWREIIKDKRYIHSSEGLYETLSK
ncbi:MAG: hypothetical protein OCD76_07160 [Reichenbachiella sp.]